MFAPEKAGISEPSLVQMIRMGLDKVNVEMRAMLVNEIVLAGGNTMLHGFP